MNAGSKTTDGTDTTSETVLGTGAEVSRPDRGRILSLDDSDAILGLLRACWEEAGYDPWTTNDEAAAMALLCFSERIDLFTQDLDRPDGIGGLEVLRQMQSHPKLRQIPVLIISAYPLWVVRQMMKGSGLDLEQTVAGYVRKPFRATELIAKTRTILAGGKTFEPGSILPLEISDLGNSGHGTGVPGAEAGLVAELRGLAHDFNNLLTVIRARAQIVLEDTALSGQTSESLQRIVAATDEAVILTRQLARLR